MTAAKSKVEIRFNNGALAPQYTRFELHEKFSDPIDLLRVEFAPLEKDVRYYADQLQKGNRLHVHIDGKPQLDAMIETVDTSVSHSGGVVFSIEAPSPIKLLYQASADPGISKVYQNDAKVVDFIADLVEPFGIGEVIVSNDLAIIKCKTGQPPKGISTPASDLTHRDAQIQLGETAYQCAARVLTRLGCMLRMGPNRDGVYVTAPHYDTSPLYALTVGREGETILGDRFIDGVKITDTNDGQFSFCYVEGVSRDDDGAAMAITPVSFSEWKQSAAQYVAAASQPSTPAPTTAQVGSAFVLASRPPFRGGAFPYKPIRIRDTNCRDSKRAASVAKLKLGLAAEKAFVVSGIVEGFVSREGIPWTVDTLANVHIAPLGLSEVLWINERVFYEDKDGQRTSITLIPKHYFTIGDASS